nr:magnesium transporter [Nitrospirota bacterium]
MASPDPASSPVNQEPSPRSALLVHELLRREPQEAEHLLSEESPSTIASVLAALPTAKALALLPRFDAALRSAILKAASPEQRERWLYNPRYPKGSVGYLMEPVVATFAPTDTVREVVERLRAMVAQAFVSYGYVVDAQGRLSGVLVMRELLLAAPDQPVGEVMLTHSFFLTPTQLVQQVTPLVHSRHYPEYPVCDDEGRIVGIVRGYALFQAQTLELTAQPGKMVGVDREERVRTNPWRSLSLRQPWLQINLASSFLAAGVVGFYEDTVTQVVAVAAFLPVMVGQSASTGGQALAVALRGLTLGELDHRRWRALAGKEALVGIANGVLVGLTAGAGIYAYASFHGHAGAGWLAAVMLAAMTISTMVSSVVGAVTPSAMQRLGYDPASAATILVGGVTRIVSIAVFLALTSWVLL